MNKIQIALPRPPINPEEDFFSTIFGYKAWFATVEGEFYNKYYDRKNKPCIVNATFNVSPKDQGPFGVWPIQTHRGANLSIVNASIIFVPERRGRNGNVLRIFLASVFEPSRARSFNDINDFFIKRNSVFYVPSDPIDKTLADSLHFHLPEVLKNSSPVAAAAILALIRCTLSYWDDKLATVREYRHCYFNEEFYTQQFAAVGPTFNVEVIKEKGCYVSRLNLDNFA